MTNPPRSENEPVEESVRTFLWRLRARLVNPPHEERVAADLDRLFVAAREHAHGEPLFGDRVGIDRAAAPAGADDGAVADTSDTEVLPDGVAAIFGTPPVDTSPFASRHLGSLFGRVAAAAVLLVAVGGGIAGARDSNVSLNALLGRAGTPEIDASEDDLLALEPTPGADTGTDEPVEPDPEPVDADVTSDAPVQPRTDSDDTGSAGSDAPATPDTGAEPTGDPAPAPSRDASGSDGGSDAPADPAPDTDDTPPVTEPVEDEIIAAPPPEPAPRPVDGFGGPTCPENGDPALCDPDGDTDDGAGTDSGGEQDPEDADGDTATTEDEVDVARDELARRRGGA